LLEVKKISAGYGSLQILAEVSLSAKDKQITVIVGPNGSGKSTLLKSVFGLTRIYSGEIAFDGKIITGLPTHKIARMGIAYLPQVESVFPSLTIRENLRMAGYTVNGPNLEAQIKQVSEMFPILQEARNRKASLLSGGERQMLAMAMALIRDPRLIMFDEPTANLSPKLALLVLSKIVEIRDRLGVTVILVEQNARKALEIGNRTYLLASGRCMFEGKPEELLAHPELSRLCLGLGIENHNKTSEGAPSDPGIC